MTSSNGNLFRITGHLCGARRPETRSFVLVDFNMLDPEHTAIVTVEYMKCIFHSDFFYYYFHCSLFLRCNGQRVNIILDNWSTLDRRQCCFSVSRICVTRILWDELTEIYVTGINQCLYLPTKYFEYVIKSIWFRMQQWTQKQQSAK